MISSAAGKCSIERRWSTWFGLSTTYLLVLSVENPRLHDQWIHMQKLLGLIMGYLELKLYKNASNVFL